MVKSAVSRSFLKQRFLLPFYQLVFLDFGYGFLAAGRQHC